MKSLRTVFVEQRQRAQVALAIRRSRSQDDRNDSSQ